MNAIEQLKSVLCNHDGKCCIAGSEEDRAIVDRALQALAQPYPEAELKAAYAWIKASEKIIAEQDAKLKLALYRAVKTYHEGKPVYVAQPTSGDYALGYAEGFNDACKKPQQEPVAWMHNFIEGGISIGKRPADLERHPDRWTALYKDPKPCPTCEALARTVMLDQTSHDAAPPQRTWAGLTDEDLKLLSAEWRIVYGAWMDDFAQDIEAKLKEKNT